MKGYYLLIIVMISLSCDGSKKPVKPDNLISKDKMMNILYDAYVLNASKASNRKTLEANGIFPETYLYEKYDIDSVQFANSNTYYAYDAEGYKAMISSIKNRLNKDKQVYDNLLKAEEEAKKRRQDSLRKVREKRADSIKRLKIPEKEKKKKLNAKS